MGGCNTIHKKKLLKNKKNKNKSTTRGMRASEERVNAVITLALMATAASR